MNKRISVIVAVYNTEKYIEKCIKSLLNQTYPDLEIIIVEDGSTDDSKKILKKYSDNEKIKIIYNEKNYGLSYSRNVGLKYASGDFIGYIDSDDYIDLDYYEKLMVSIEENKSEIALCDMKVVYEDTGAEQISKCYTGEAFNLYNVINNGLVASACNKLFKKDLISKYKFAEGKVNEDIAVVIPSLVNAKKISYAKTFYYYVQRGGSIQNSGFSDKRFDIFTGVETTLERIKDNDAYEKLKDAIIFNQLIVLLFYVIPKETNFIKRGQILKKYHNFIIKYNIKDNKNYQEFLSKESKVNRIYYSNLVTLNVDNLIALDNLLISLYYLLKKLKRLKYKKIIPNITLDELEAKAKKQYLYEQTDIKISVIVPNYNYGRFLYQRIYSILNQNYKIFELIILDDKSKDNSMEIIENIVNRINKYIDVRLIKNDVNSGNAFNQWQKGLEMAHGDYVWICEADDYCKKNFLKKVTEPIRENKDIVISYADTGFIDGDGNVIKKSLIDQIDLLKTNHWHDSYVNDGIEEINNYTYLNCTIPNVSGTIIKTGNYGKILEKAKTFKQCGDWYFYINVLKLGKIAYNKKTLNYYRLHGNNISSTMDKEKHLLEIERIYAYLKDNDKVTKEQEKNMKDRIAFLKNVWGIR